MFMFFLALLFLLINCHINAEPHPIGFAIPEIKIVPQIPEKTRDFAIIVPGELSTYIYKKEEDYYKGYQEAYFAITKAKSGWDCLRHYEILCNGCIPYFLDIDKCPEQDMTFLPKKLIKMAMNLEGVSYLHIDHNKFNKQKYYKILNKLLDHTRKYLTTKAMAKYVLKTINYMGKGKILYLSQHTQPDYLRCLLLIGFKELYPKKIIDVPKIPHIYASYEGDLLKLYGCGMSYTKIIPDIPINRENIEQRIINKEFDLIIYGSIHYGMPYYDLVTQYYQTNEIVYFCGEDFHACPFKDLNNLFLREFL